MPRRNHMKHPQRQRIEDRFDTDVCFLPHRPEIDRVICVPLKTIYRNMDAGPWAEDVYTVRSIDDPIAREIMRQL